MKVEGAETNELLTVKETAKLLQLSESKVRDLQSARQLTFIKVGGAVRFDRRDILEYLKRRKVHAVH